MAKQNIVINEIKNLGSGTWRVDWFGAIERNPSVQTEFLVRVILSRLKENWTHQDVATDNAVDSQTRCSVLIGVGQLPVIFIGSLWLDGQCLPVAAGQFQSLNLEISPSTISILKSSDLIDGKALVPYSFHQVSGAGMNALCLNVAHGNDPAAVIIPAMEVIRFYYATSSNMSKAIFDGKFTHDLDSLVNPNYTGMVNGRKCVVCRRKNLTDDDCWAIGRVLNSQEAFMGACKIHDSLIKAQVNNVRTFPETGFPFTGKTTIRARCKLIGWEKKRWLILSLISCSGAFPFDQLEVIPDNDGRKADPDTDKSDDEKKPAWTTPRKKSLPVDEASLQSVIETESNTEKFEIDCPQDRFYAIKNIKMSKRKKEECDYKAGELKTIVILNENTLHGTGDGSSAQTGVTPTNIETSGDRKGLPASLDGLIAMLEKLNNYPGISAKLHPFPQGEGLIKATLTNKANKRQWSYLHFRIKKIRHFMVADIQYAESYFTLIEVERRPDSPTDTYLAELLFHADGSAISSGELAKIAEGLSKVDGRIKHLPTLPYNILRLGKGMKHTWKDADEYAKIIAGQIENAKKSHC